MAYIGSGPTRFNTADELTVTGDAEFDTDTLVIDSTNNRVGIGTSSPDKLLELSSNTDATLKITSTDPALLLDEVVGAIEFETADSGNSGVAAKIEAIAENASGEIGLSFSTGAGGSAAEAVRIDRDKNLQFNSGFGSVATAYGCRAWVNFNGTGTVAIREDGNVSSITDNGTADYTVNFTTAMPDTNFAAIAQAGTNTTGTPVQLGYMKMNFSPSTNSYVAPTTSSVRISVMDSSSYDLIDVHCAIFR